jgi:hypothetical protein
MALQSRAVAERKKKEEKGGGKKKKKKKRKKEELKRKQDYCTREGDEGHKVLREFVEPVGHRTRPLLHRLVL